MTRYTMAKYIEMAKRRETDLYLAGLRQGKEDFINGTNRIRDYMGVDTALQRGYIQGYEGWRIALENEAKKKGGH